MLDFFNKLQANRDIKALYGAFNSRNECRSGTQFVHSQPQQEWREHDITCHLPAYTHPEAMRMASINDHPDQSDDRRMGRLVQVSDVLVQPIDCDRILNK